TLRNIVAEAERLQKLTNQLLRLSKTEAMDTVPDLVHLPLDRLLLEVVERFPAQRLKLNFDDFGNEPIVLANEELLQTAFANIVDNALKYSQNEMVVIDFTQNKNNYVLRVSDQGIGINEADLKQIYVPLFRARNARKLHGHGVGLPLARRIIMLHKGQLLVESQGEGKGTVVTVSIPK
ncbi:MAG: HAMP domain-containing histidine kinase, partial [Saprospiraceae bacterium]|nr:HAMP domain-containing histidine kinase [Saprospiraceae bacterium]